MPDLDIGLVSIVAVPGLAIAVVSFTVTVSLGRIFSRRHNYEIVPNQVEPVYFPSWKFS